jgi:hypothetical protein
LFLKESKRDRSPVFWCAYVSHAEFEDDHLELLVLSFRFGQLFVFGLGSEGIDCASN